MAILTTLVRLLELKVTELESSTEGTGSLERDEQLLSPTHRGKLSDIQKHAVVYRLGQKRLARAYLLHVSRLLQEEMKVLSGLQGRLEQLEAK